MTKSASVRSRLTGSRIASIERSDFEEFVRFPGRFGDPYAPLAAWVARRWPLMPETLSANVIYASGALSSAGWPHDLASDIQRLDFDNTGSWVATFTSRQETGTVRDPSAIQYRLNRRLLEEAVHTWHYIAINRGFADRWAADHIGEIDFRLLQRLVVDGGLVKKQEWPFSLQSWVDGLILRADGTFEVLDRRS